MLGRTEGMEGRCGVLGRTEGIEGIEGRCGELGRTEGEGRDGVDGLLDDGMEGREEDGLEEPEELSRSRRFSRLDCA